jgi:hypothetical protein
MKVASGSKRARVASDHAAPEIELPGHEQLLIATPLQARLGKKYCDETELLPLLLVHGFVQRVRTIEIEVRPLGGDSFKIRLDAARPSVGEAKAEIARAHGTPQDRQELYKVVVSADGSAVREDDVEPEPLEDANIDLGDGDVMAMAVKEVPLVWRTFPAGRVSLTEDGAVATQAFASWSLTTSEIELTEGRHYWEVELLNRHICVGVCSPDLDPNEDFCGEESTDGWFIRSRYGSLFGNGKNEDEAGEYGDNDRVGILLDLDDGSLLFFRNGVQHGPGYPPGSVRAPVSHAIQMFNVGKSGKLLRDAQWPVGHCKSTKLKGTGL